jgi:aryl sulfotransferase
VATEEIDRPLVRRSNFVEDSSRWDGFEFRSDDIVISTPPKCGTSWVQMITALLVFQTPELPAPLTTLSPWLDLRLNARREVFANLERQTHRRFIKTHTPRWGIPITDGVTYICAGRDPRDVALSWDDHLANADPEVAGAKTIAAAEIDGVELPPPSEPPPTELGQSIRAKFWRWVLDDTAPTTALSSLWSTLDHVRSFWDVRDAENTVLVHYHDLRADLEGQMRSVADQLSIDVPAGRWSSLVKAASLEEMRRRPSMTAPEPGLYLDAAAFFKNARRGEWHEIIDNEQDLHRYNDRVASLASPEVSAWMHRS